MSANQEIPGARFVARFVVTGRVQGVGFRYFVRTLARELKLAGRVWNRPDGAVEIEAAGPEPALAELARRLLAEGPGHPMHVEKTPLAEGWEVPAGDRFDIERR
ncbi:MAG TPA: acylphosphatase [Thermoanaerobaculia bacterium]|nr:acylphosphatase [Thermoanaerobaculia bacterium]